MNTTEIDKILEEQRAFFDSGKTLPVAFRIEMLKKLKSEIKSSINEIYAAIKSDLGKCSFESYMCEVGMTLSEIGYMIKNVRKLAKDKRVRTPLHEFISTSFVKAMPYGNVLIMSPWNYPFLLTLSPLADAIAAGNTAIVKPSAYSPATSAIIEKLISKCYPKNYVAVVTGGRQENSFLLEKKFDLIFFTGSQAVGKEVMRHAANYLTPVVLELGGKSPCIVDSTANLKVTARRIVFGKYLNCGQTCVAPDYILCDKAVKDELIREIVKEIARQLGTNPLDNENYGKIINQKHFERILKLIDTDKVVIGGESQAERCRIVPTVMDNVTWDDAVMQEEIFGPVLPVLTYNNLDEAIKEISKRQKPLALYMFSENKKNIRDVTSRCRYGGGCINDTIIHLATSEMGFGGVGESGMGSYHGKDGFKAFSHYKSILNKKSWLDLPMRYQPYTKSNDFLIHKFLK